VHVHAAGSVGRAGREGRTGGTRREKAPSPFQAAVLHRIASHRIASAHPPAAPTSTLLQCILPAGRVGRPRISHGPRLSVLKPSTRFLPRRLLSPLARLPLSLLSLLRGHGRR